MRHRDLREFCAALEAEGELRHVWEPVSALTKLFGTPRRVALDMGASEVSELRDVGRVLASLKEPEPPKGLKDTGRLLHMIKSLWDMKPASVRQAACQQVVIDGEDVDLLRLLPVQTCWPGDAGPNRECGVMLQVPASAEIVLEGHIPMAACGDAGHSEHGVPRNEVSGYFRVLKAPFSDHTGCYHEQDWFPFTYTKFIVVTDDDVDIRQWSEVIWAITTRVGPGDGGGLGKHSTIRRSLTVLPRG